MITNPDQDILLATNSQVRAVERFRKDLECIFRIQTAKNKYEGGFSFPIYTTADYDGGVYQYNYMTYFGLKFWEWDKEQQERQIQMQIDTAYEKIISHMTSIGCDLETLKPKSSSSELPSSIPL